MKLKRGDTLIEVALAIGIFSMVAITVVSVTTASTTAAQASLEVTLTREEIDAQAEALRFIHDSYLAGSQSADTSQNLYKKLWEEIAGRATDGSPTKDFNNAVDSCEKLYANGANKSSNRLNTNANVGNSKSFIINTRRLGDIKSGMNSSQMTSAINKIVIKNPATYSGIFVPPETYPRILYGNQTSEDFYTQAEGGDNNIARVEGLFIVGFKPISSTKIIDGTIIETQAAYYDFYVRACWMPPGATRASTISTVVRLSDPAIIEH